MRLPEPMGMPLWWWITGVVALAVFMTGCAAKPEPTVGDILTTTQAKRTCVKPEQLVCPRNRMVWLEYDPTGRCVWQWGCMRRRAL
jgi:hypothetical protein